MATTTDPALSVPELAALVVLMAEARELTNPEMTELAGISLTGPTRLRLMEKGLVDSRKVGRPYAHQLTDKGWRVCRELTTGTRPARPGTAGNALLVLLANLHRGLETRRISHAEFFAHPAGDPGPGDPGDPGPGPGADVDARIRAAYRDLAASDGAWVGLADLRDALPDVDRDTLDAALRRLDRAPDAHVIPSANLKALTARDRAAAVTLGGEASHVLSVEGGA